MLHITRNIFVLTVVFISLGCNDSTTITTSRNGSNTPHVRLVKDDPREFHFQWDAPLKEERIILISVREMKGEQVPLADSDLVEIRSVPSSETEEALVHFQTGSFISKPIRFYAPPSWPSLAFIAILPSSERDKFSLPTHAFLDLRWAWQTPDKGMERTQRILKEHPFKPYRLGKPSQIIFEPPEPRIKRLSTGEFVTDP